MSRSGFRAVAALLGVLVSSAVALQAEAGPQARSVAVEQVPGLRAYLDRAYGYDLGPSAQISVRLADLDAPADGVDEVLLSVESGLTCGSRGCDRKVLRRGPGGRLQPILEVTAHELTISRKPRRGVYRVIAASHGGETAFDLSGKTSAAVARPGQGAVVASGAAPSAEIKGACREGAQWRLTSDGRAVFGACDGGRVQAELRCEPAARDRIVLRLNGAPRGARAGAALSGLVVVDDGQFYPLAGRVMRAGAGPDASEFRFSSRDGLLNALKGGRVASLSADQLAVRVHLSGSGKVLAAMLSRCGGAI